ncbi:Zinc finger C2H2 type family protein [Brugia pahangi]
MFFNIFMTPITWFNLLLCIASDNETFHLPNFDTANEVITNNTYSGISDTFGFLDYLNFEPMFSPEFPSDPSQFIDFAQLSETEDISSEESKSETNQITNSPHPGFSDIYDPFGHTNFELSLSSDIDSYRNFWRDANEELKTSDDNLRYPSIRDAQNETSSSLNLNSNDIITYMHLPGPQQSAVPTHFHQLTPPAGDTSGQHGNAEQCNIDNKHFSDNLNILNYRENAYKGLETDKNDYTCHYPGCTVITKTRKEYLTHRKTHGQPFIYECKVPDCGRTFDHKSSFYNHIETHELHPRCGYCDKFFTNRNALRKHNRLCEIKFHKKNHTCYYRGCTVITKNYNEHATHKKTHGQPFIYECKVPGCGRTFDHESTFYSHRRTHEPHPQCECCGKVFVSKNALTYHKKRCPTKSHERCYECFYLGCTMITNSYKEYITHKKTHGQPFIYECKLTGCGRTFDHESTFHSHKRMHESHPQCECCGKSFNTRKGLHQHKKIQHTAK